MSAAPGPPPVAPRVGVVVLTYHSASTLAACLAALRPQVDEVGGTLQVVDNGSTDDTLAVARSLGVEAHPSGGNLGFAAGCNLGARLLDGSDLLVFVNPDAVLAPGCLRALVDAVGDQRGPLGGRAHHEDGRYDVRSVHGRPCVRGALAFATGLDRLGRGRSWLDPEHGPGTLPADGPPRPVAAVSGALMAVPAPLWQVLGGFDEGYFLYGEDVDLCLRAAAAGWQPTVVPTAGYGHIGGVSSGGGGSGDVLLYRGKVELYERHLSRVGARVAVLALEVGVLLRALVGRAGPGGQRRARRWEALYRARASWRQGYRERRAGDLR